MCTIAYLSAACMTTAEEDGKEVLWLLLKAPRTLRPFSSIIVAIVYYPAGQNAECGIDMIEYTLPET